MQSDMTKLRKAYDEFLKQFPLCHDVWIQYTTLESGTGTKKVQEIYDRAIKCSPYSLHLWCSYSEFLISSGENQDVIRR